MALRLRLRSHAAWIGGLTLIGTLSAVTPRQARAAGQASITVLNGVYTETQAQRGRKVYADSCQMCHGDPPAGTSIAPTLTGPDFLADFGGMTAADLFSKIQKTMPSDDPGTLKPDQTADVLAYVFWENKWPAGQQDLGTDTAALKRIRIVPK
jgi:cytochrome c